MLGERLHRDSIDQSTSPGDQLNAYLNSSGDYVATTSTGEYHGMLRRSDVRNALVDQLIRDAADVVTDR